MIMSILPTEEILAKLAPIYAERGVAATYWQHTGTTRNDDGENEDQWEKIDIVALIGKPHKWSTTAGGVNLQIGSDAVHFRSQELPDGVSETDLTRNDKFELGTATGDAPSKDALDIADIRWVEDLVVRIQLEAG